MPLKEIVRNTYNFSSKKERLQVLLQSKLTEIAEIELQEYHGIYGITTGVGM